MKLILKDNRRYVLRFDSGEEFIGKFKEFCVKKNIEAGFFTGIGATSEITLGLFDLDTKKYIEKDFKENLEVVGLTGNISKTRDNTTLHVHGVFGTRSYESIAGHVKKLVVSVTLEIHLIALDGKINRKIDEKTGLNLMD